MMLNKFVNIIKNKPAKALMLFYGVIVSLAIIISLILATGTFAAHKLGYFEEKSLNLNDFEQIGVEQTGDMTMVNATDDTQLIYKKNVHNLYVKCSFSYDPGEFILFYSKSPDGGFGTNKMLIAQKHGDYYVFQMPLDTKSFRLDTGVSPSITVEFDEIIVNKSGFYNYFRLTTSGLFWLFIIPPVLYGIAASLIELYDRLKSKLKKTV